VAVASIYKSEAGCEVVERHYRRALQRWPVPNRQMFIPTGQGETFVIVSGENQTVPVVLLHGSGTNSSAWLGDVAEWAQHYRVYAVDMIGEPGLSAPSRPSLQSNAYADWLDDVWDHLGLTAASVVGISLGGWLGLEYAVKRPRRVASLSLLSPSGIGSQNQMFLVKAGLLTMCGRWGRRRSLRLVTGRASLPPEVAESLVVRFQHFRPRMERLPIRTDEELASLKMPVQLILGGRDALIRSEETRNRMQRHVSHLQLTYLAREGHILPRQTNDIAAFLKSVSSEILPSDDLQLKTDDRRLLSAQR
jgi:pimeloyl-ACP methyl ester carboxylesterase